MIHETTDRGFHLLHIGERAKERVQQSSAILNYPGAFDKPGSSALWIGDAHLDREAVAELVWHLQHWLHTGNLFEGDSVCRSHGGSAGGSITFSGSCGGGGVAGGGVVGPIGPATGGNDDP